MNQYQEEFEEVESPFAPKANSLRQSSQRERLRNKKNVFNRPFSSAPSSAPLVIEGVGSARRIMTNQQEISDEFEDHESDLADTPIDYLEEVVEKRPVARSTQRKSNRANKNLLPKIGWTIIGVLVLRLITMDRGVWDYFATEGKINEKRMELKSIQKENKDLKVEIARIQLDKNYQRQLAKEHLGVIAVDEFLVLFASESKEKKSASTDSL